MVAALPPDPYGGAVVDGEAVSREGPVELVHGRQGGALLVHPAVLVLLDDAGLLQAFELRPDWVHPVEHLAAFQLGDDLVLLLVGLAEQVLVGRVVGSVEPLAALVLLLAGLAVQVLGCVDGEVLGSVSGEVLG